MVRSQRSEGQQASTNHARHLAILSNSKSSTNRIGSKENSLNADGSIPTTRFYTHKPVIREYQRRLHNCNRRLTRAQAAKEALQVELKATQVIKRYLERRVLRAARDLESMKGKQEEGKQQKRRDKKKKDALRKRSERLKKSLLKAKEKARDATISTPGPQMHRLKSKGIITDDSRDMIHELDQLGVAFGSIGPVIEAVSKHLNVHVEDTISRRGAGRVIHEGDVLSDIQLGHELLKTDGVLNFLY
jgi:hypothetical protein